MRASRHLGRLHTAVQHRVDRLSRLFQSIDNADVVERSRRLSYIAIELDNLNICALREFTISTIRKAKTLSGSRISVTSSIEPEDEIAAYMLSIVNSVKYAKMKSPARIKRNEEQAIRDPKQIANILTDCSASNLPSLQVALSLNSSMFMDLKFLRHFYAHRNIDTLRKTSLTAANLGLLKVAHPDEMLLHPVSGKSNSILEEWLADARIFYELLMQ